MISFNFYVWCAIWMCSFFSCIFSEVGRLHNIKKKTKLKQPSNDTLYNPISSPFLCFFCVVDYIFALALWKIVRDIVFFIFKMHIAIWASVYLSLDYFLLVFHTHTISLLNIISEHWCPHILSWINAKRVVLENIVLIRKY